MSDDCDDCRDCLNEYCQGLANAGVLARCEYGAKEGQMKMKREGGAYRAGRGKRFVDFLTTTFCFPLFILLVQLIQLPLCFFHERNHLLRPSHVTRSTTPHTAPTRRRVCLTA